MIFETGGGHPCSAREVRRSRERSAGAWGANAKLYPIHFTFGRDRLHPYSPRSVQETSDAPAQSQGVAPERRAVSARAVVIGLVFAALLCALTPSNDFKLLSTYIAGTQFPMGALWVELLLVLINAVLWKWRPRSAFTKGELLTVWVLIAVPSGIPSSGMMRYFLGHLLVPHYFSDSNNRWQELVWGGTPRWLQVTDKAAVKHFYEGYPWGEEHIPWEGWIGPLFFWGILVVLF